MGFHVCMIGTRGQQGIRKMTSNLVSCPGRCSDVREVVDYVHAKFCNDNSRRIYAAGFSIGGNKLAKMVGLDGPSSKLSGAYCCQPPLKYWETINNLKQAYFGIFDKVAGMKVSLLH